MDLKKINIIWSICLIVIGLISIISVGANIAAIKLPDVVVRVLGVIDLLLLPVLIFTTVKKIKCKK